jgi:hypothetical protein
VPPDILFFVLQRRGYLIPLLANRPTATPLQNKKENTREAIGVLYTGHP